MNKVKPPDGYPPEKGRYARGNDYSPVAVCVILDTFDFMIPAELTELVVAGVDAGAALSGMLQTENIGIEKMLCNIAANPNIRYLVLCGRESTGHLPGEALIKLKENNVDETRRIVGSQALTPVLSNIPLELIDRFRQQIVSIVNLLCKPGEKSRECPGLNSEMIAQAVKSCYQEEPTEFHGYVVHDIGAYTEPVILYQIENVLKQMDQQFPAAGGAKMGMGLMLHKLLPKTNCGKCGRKTCLAYAIDLAKGKCTLEECSELATEAFQDARSALQKLLG